MQTAIPTQGHLAGVPGRPEHAARFPLRTNEPEPCGKIESLFVASKKVQLPDPKPASLYGPEAWELLSTGATSLTTLVFHLYLPYTMPATRSKKGKRSKAAAAPPVPVPAIEPIPEPEPKPEVEVEHKTVDNNAMQTDQPESSNSTSLVETAANIVASAEATVVNGAEVVVEMVEDVVKAASEFVEETTMGGIEENSRSTSGSGNAPVDSEKEAVSKLTLEERKAKLDELRRKMVRLLLLSLIC